MTRHSEGVARYWGLPVPGHLKHGVRTTAARFYGCDCKLCLPSGKRRGPGTPQAERQRKSVQRLRGTPVPPDLKHGIYVYRAYGCKCDVCRAAKAANKRQVDNRWRATACGDWQDGAELTTVHWPPRGFGWWECPHCAEKFEMRP